MSASIRRGSTNDRREGIASGDAEERAVELLPLFDAHCHFDFPEFDGRRESILARFDAEGILGLVIPGVRQADWSRVCQTARGDSRLSYCLGIHPWFVAEHDREALVALERRLSERDQALVALGECGMDALKPDLERQGFFFDAQIRLAKALDLPLVIHSVRMHDDVFAMLSRARFEGTFLVHGFSGSYEQAYRFARQGGFIGVGGVITYQRARKTRDAISRLPLSCLVLETDAPDMLPAGIDAGHNNSLALRRIFEALCALRQETATVLAETLLDNVRRLYRRKP
ncbi:TatD family hydrolase [Mangrovitalea sediminis]|uniref:TatD family hydrolase n=1 Tax=Mangrovitalea sediminis TaxID=1982043 RepID=UPI001D0CF3E5|nr:TatD family hydrolase [Mangrovitalea sediminis]